MTVGIVIFGAIQTHVFQRQLTSLLAGGAQTRMTRFAKMDPRAILTPETRQRIPLPILHEFSRAIAYSVTHTLLWDLIPAGLAFVMLFWMGAARFRGMHHAEMDADGGV